MAATFIGKLLFDQYEKAKTCKEEIEVLKEDNLSLERYLLNSTYDFALRCIRNFYEDVTEDVNENGSRIITGQLNDIRGHLLNYSWLFTRKNDFVTGYYPSIAKELCTHVYITCNQKQVEELIKREQVKGLELFENGWYNPQRRLGYFFDECLGRYCFEITYTERREAKPLTSAQKTFSYLTLVR